MLIKKICSKIYTYYLLCFYKTIQLGNNAVIDYRCEIEEKSNLHMGEESVLYKHVTLYKRREGTFSMGAFSHIAPYGYFLIEKQSVMIGDHVAIGPFCSLHCSSNTIPNDKNVLFSQSYIKAHIPIGNNIFIGAQCVILPNTVIEDNVVIAANSTIKGELKSGFLYGGNPAVAIKALEDA